MNNCAKSSYRGLSNMMCLAQQSYKEKIGKKGYWMLDNVLEGIELIYSLTKMFTRKVSSFTSFFHDVCVHKKAFRPTLLLFDFSFIPDIKSTFML